MLHLDFISGLLTEYFGNRCGRLAELRTASSPDEAPAFSSFVDDLAFDDTVKE